MVSVVCRRRRRLSASSVTLPVGGRDSRRARGRSVAAGPGAWWAEGSRHFTAGQYGYVPLGRYLVRIKTARFVWAISLLPKSQSGSIGW